MRRGHGFIILGCTVFALIGVALFANIDLARLARFIGTTSFVVLVIAFVVEWRRRSKRF